MGSLKAGVLVGRAFGSLPEMGACLLLGIALALTALGPLANAATDRSPNPLFSSYDVVPLQLEAPFKDLFAQARTNEEYAVTGRLRYTRGGRGVAVDGVKVSVRGHTSRRETECAFPKLK